jgi:Lrp/AsnC family transcriptional regulator, leucine-responsive regulatory protein
MKLGNQEHELDDIDLHILSILQENCKLQLAKIGDRVGLSAPAVIERIKKLEDSAIITGYRALVDGRRIGLDVTAFIGVSISHPRAIDDFENGIALLDGVLECHHVTGQHTLLLKVKTEDTSTLEELISKIRSMEGVDRTETMVVLSTHTERTQVAIHFNATPAAKRPRRNGDKAAVHLKGV